MSVTDKLRKLVQLDREQVEKIQKEQGCPIFCHYCSKTIRMEEISAIVQVSEGKYWFACTRHYVNAARGES